MRARGAVIAAVTTLALICAGCGVTMVHGSPAKHGRAKDPPSTTATTTPSSVSTDPSSTTSAVSGRPSTQLILDGYSLGSLSERAYQRYRRQGGPDTVTIEEDGASTAFHQLCTHNADIVDSSASINAHEIALCHKDGIEPVQIQVGSDAVVLATENETDVGVDCLTVAQVRAIFRAGSPVTNWEQLGFDDERLAVAGPNPQDPNFSYFGRFLVGQQQPTIEDFRYDYHPEPFEARIRAFVVGSERKGELASAALPAETGEVSSLRALLAGWRDTLRGAEQWLRTSTRQDKLADITAAEQKRDRALRAIAQLEHQLAAVNVLVARNRRILAAAERVLGNLGVFEYGYYTLWEQQLRPIEVTASASPENCVFPSQATITSGDYPLSRRLLLTFSLQELRGNEGLRDFLISYLKNASALAARLVVVPLPTNVLNQEETWLDGTTPTTTTATTTVPQSNGENSMSASANGVQGSGQGTTTTANSGTGQPASGGAGGSDLIPQGVH